MPADCEDNNTLTAAQIGDESVRALSDEAPLAACLARQAIERASAEGNLRIVGAGYFNLGRSMEKLGCPLAAWRAFRVSLCHRPRGSAPDSVIARVEERCHRLGDCSQPCSELEVPAGVGRPTPFLVPRGASIPSVDAAHLCNGCREFRREAVMLGATNVTILFMEHHSQTEIYERVLGHAVAIVAGPANELPRVLLLDYFDVAGGLGDEFNIEPVLSTGIHGSFGVNLISTCRGYYDEPGNDESYIPSDTCMERRVDYQFDATRAWFGEHSEH